ncbi:FAD-dependent oxidoreductase [Actinomycetospora callitridis]|uniref:FAD-dependent oxidoreductase n=1 Tax=Actinomycetospora callitridis TaxID=913944 RepID=UPI0023663EF0|nr:FAD-dependent oxidoreductase [Actinomycetospora callitridis]MDD7920203.1 FAD-dependent oxidoreductase [Actinomycetospora callitridis]
MTTVTATDVLVVGAGPVGLTLAADLLRRGVDVRVIDQAPGPASTSRATSITPRTLEVLDDLGVAGALVDTGVRITDTEAYAGASLTFRISFPPTDTTRFPFLLNTSQRRTEEVLTDLVATSGGCVERDRRLIGFRQERDGVVVQVAGPRVSEEIRAGWVVGADGGRSTVRRTLGLPFRGTGADLEETIVLADVLLDRDLAPDRIYSWFNEDGALLAFPFSESGRWRVTAALSPEEMATGRFTKDSLGRFTELYRRRTGDDETRLSDMQGFSVYRVNQRVVDHYRRGRVVLAGDAAHVHTPAGGLGMNTGIQDAYSLGWRLALALTGGDDRVVDDYERERRPIAEGLLTSTGGLQRLYGIRDRRVQRARDATLRTLLDLGPLRRAFFLRAAQLDITYATARRWPWQRGVGVGDRVPDGPVRRRPDGRPTWLHEHLRGPRPALVLLHGAPPTRDDRTALDGPATRAAGLGVPVLRVITADDGVAGTDAGVTTLIDAGGTVHRRFGVATPAAVVVRPDAHVALVAAAHRGADVESALRDLWIDPVRV